MNVLIGCECSGVVREAFRAKGHNAWSCDLLPATDGSSRHFTCDVREILSMECWDLAIFHPPCTHLAASGALHFAKKHLEQMAALDFVRQLLHAPIPKIALENPVGIISTRIRKPTQIIQPYQFGHDASKKTCLWLEGLPPLKGTRYVPGQFICQNGHRWAHDGGLPRLCRVCGCSKQRELWANQTPSGQNKLGPSPTRAAQRSVTYSGIAQAMADQWGAA